MKTIVSNSVKKTSEAKIVKSMIHSFRIEKIIITDNMAKNALERVQLRLKKS